MYQDHPLSIREGSIIWDKAREWTGELLWPDDVGPFEEFFRIADFGAMFVTGGTSQAILMIASLLGVGLQDLGRGIDSFLHLRTVKDVAGAHPVEMTAALLGMSTSEVERATQAGKISENSMVLYNMIVKKAGDAEFIKEYNLTPEEVQALHNIRHPPAGQGSGLKAKDITEVIVNKKLQKYDKEMQEAAAHAVKPKWWQEVFKPQDVTKNLKLEREGYGILTDAIKKTKSWKAKGVIVTCLLVICSWIVQSAAIISHAPWQSKMQVARAAAEVAVPNYLRKKFNLDVKDAIVSPSSATGQALEKRRAEVFTNEPASPRQQLELQVDAVLSGAV